MGLFQVRFHAIFYPVMELIIIGRWTEENNSDNAKSEMEMKDVNGESKLKEYYELK
ncbi:hypothetical protein [Psychrobacillus sp. OK032]|uniref:hypothetical protein n=1 Tax=Psychrobacillus sp. OK032 TaxID=1884358 RepID=UPI0015A6D59C|nr:hypothetical protein [Psychrobacillus sp. OK032]